MVKALYSLMYVLPPSIPISDFMPCNLLAELMNRVIIMIVSITMWMIFDIWTPSTPSLISVSFISSPTFAERPEWARRLMCRGHTIASHTWSHTDMTTLSYEQLHGELAKVEQAFIRILGKKPLYVCLPVLSIFQSPL